MSNEFRNSALSTLRVSNAITNLDQIVSGINWGDSFTVGAGLDAITGNITSSALTPVVVKEAARKTSHTSLHFIENSSQMETEIEASISGKYNISGIDINASFSYLSKISYSETSTTLIAQYESNYTDYDLADSYKLSDQAKSLISAPDKFRAAYGDYYIAGGRRSSRFTAIYVCRTTSISNMSGFKASLGVSAPDVFSAEGSTKFMQTAKENNISISCDVYMEGYEGSYPPTTSWDPPAIIKALNWFQENEKGIFRFAYLKHYITLDPTYSCSINIDPYSFVALKKLYNAVWLVKTRYNTCPAKYQKQFFDTYNDLIANVMALSGSLPLMPDKINELTNNTQTILSNMNQVFDRQDFYYKVEQCVPSEVAFDTETIEVAGGPQYWTYGFTNYPQSGAVSIMSQRMDYSQTWIIGWRSNTFQFGPDQNSIIVGWQLMSNWQDGTNGSWWKKTNQILLKHEAQVLVQSCYDRGCDWSIIYYYVKASDYDFS